MDLKHIKLLRLSELEKILIADIELLERRETYTGINLIKGGTIYYYYSKVSKVLYANEISSTNAYQLDDINKCIEKNRNLFDLEILRFA